jgi:Family of unknown function (DUF6113)
VPLFCATAVLSAAIEVLLVPLRAGSVILPISVPLALATNVALPLMCRRVVDAGIAAALPPIMWVATVVVLASGRPEGDVLLPGGPGVEGKLGYALLLVGIFASVITVVISQPRIPAGAGPSAPAPPQSNRPASNRPISNR